MIAEDAKINGRLLTLEETQAIALEVLDELDGFCRERGITYYVGCGSLIGAARSQDLIPWDDDIDVLMKRVDYERFCNEYVDTERFKLFTYRRCDSYRHGMAKLVRCGTLFVEPTVRDDPYGVFVDIFPLDRAASPKDGLAKSIAVKKRIYNYAHVVNAIATKDNVLKNAIRVVLSSTVGRGDYRVDLQNVEALMVSGEGDLLVNHWGAYGMREFVPKEYFDGTARLPIRGKQYPVPAGYHEYLTALYGDYLQPPVDPPHYHGHAYLLC